MAVRTMLHCWKRGTRHEHTMHPERTTTNSLRVTNRARKGEACESGLHAGQPSSSERQISDL